MQVRIAATLTAISLLVLGGCNKTEEAPPPPSKVYQLGEPRPIILNDPNNPAPPPANSSYLMELEARKRQQEADRLERNALVDKSKRDREIMKAQDDRKEQADKRDFEKTVRQRQNDAKGGHLYNTPKPYYPNRRPDR